MASVSSSISLPNGVNSMVKFMVKMTRKFSSMYRFIRVNGTLFHIIAITLLFIAFYEPALCDLKLTKVSGRLYSTMSRCVFNPISTIDRTTGHVKCPLFYPNLHFWARIKGYHKPHYQPNNAISSKTLYNPAFIEKLLIYDCFRVLPRASEPRGWVMAVFRNFYAKKRGVRSRRFRDLGLSVCGSICCGFKNCDCMRLYSL